MIIIMGLCEIGKIGIGIIEGGMLTIKCLVSLHQQLKQKTL